jgi:hypothetical protein
MADPHDDDDAETGNDGSGGGGNTYPPSNAAIENVIRSAMALAGQGARNNGSSGGIAGGNGNPGIGGIGAGKTVPSPPRGAAFPPYAQLSEPSVSHHSTLSPSPGPATPIFHPAYTNHGQPQRGGYLQPQPQYRHGLGAGGMGPAPSSGYGLGQMNMNMGMAAGISGGGHHAHSNKPVSLPLFSE